MHSVAPVAMALMPAAQTMLLGLQEIQRYAIALLRNCAT
jgi:hypothetical protein